MNMVAVLGSFMVNVASCVISFLVLRKAVAMPIKDVWSTCFEGSGFLYLSQIDRQVETSWRLILVVFQPVWTNTSAMEHGSVDQFIEFMFSHTMNCGLSWYVSSSAFHALHV